MKTYCYVTKSYHTWGNSPTYCKGNCRLCTKRKGKIQVIKTILTDIFNTQ